MDVILVYLLVILFQAQQLSLAQVILSVEIGHLAGFLFAVLKLSRRLFLLDYRVGLMFSDWKKQHGIIDEGPEL